MNKNIIILFLLLFAFRASATNGNDVIGSRSTALGSFSTTLSDLWSTNNNQAGLGFVKELSAGISFENRFLLKETSYKAGAFVLPLKAGTFGLSITSFGYSAYSENKAGLSYGIKLAEKIAVGVQVNYLNTRLSGDYGQASTFTAALGVIANLSKELSIGVHVYNPNRTKLADYNNERVPTIMKLGLDYKFTDKVFLGVEAEKDINFNPVVKVGVEYHAIDILYLRGGISTNPTMSSFGFGLKLKDFKLDFSSSYHQTLGLTPSISLIYVKSK
ncbi:MAG: hypothetical protein HYU68_13970 [Bacteroidetes bacterium]|nr:hypothetical protein [Bacteroidota bacterium]